MADVVKNVTIRIGLDFSEAAKQAKGLSDAVEDAMEHTEEAVEEAEEEIKKLEEQYKSSMEKMAAESEKASQETLKIGESLRTAGDGAFTFARGIAFMSAGTEEDFQKMLQTVAKIQGAFDLFKGGVDIIKGLSEATDAWRAASAAAAAAQEAQAATSAHAATAAVGQTVATDTATVATNRLTAAMLANPVTAVLTAAAVAAAAFFLIFRKDGSEANEILEEQNRLLDEEEERLKNIEKTVASAVMEFSASQNTRALRELDLMERAEVMLGDQIERLEQARAQVETNTAEGRDRVIANLTDERTVEENLRQRIELREIEVQRLEMLSELETRQTEIRSRALEQLEEEKTRLQENLTIAEKRLEQEKERLDTAEQLGRLSEVEFAELESLTEKVRQGGELSPEELRRLEQLGGRTGKDIASRGFQERGEGRTGVFEGIEIEATPAEKALEDAQAAVDTIQERITREAAEIQEANRESWNEMLQIFREMADISEEVDTLKRELAIREAAGHGERGGAAG